MMSKVSHPEAEGGTLDVRAYGGDRVPHYPSVPACGQNHAGLVA